ncbi:hypothetical protein KFE25_008442 [Diacronema lutheri]|uniref:Uncharacterized protein n=1 Tax=Diacronema lutheri TaxID=2081491 RepID=A0A8J6C616_DIALT|nr:hypothetical protein KFE25_008442 [Diacronema lutheri]
MSTQEKHETMGEKLSGAKESAKESLGMGEKHKDEPSYAQKASDQAHATKEQAKQGAQHAQESASRGAQQAKESTEAQAQKAKGAAEDSGSYIGDKLSNAKESVKETLGLGEGKSTAPSSTQQAADQAHATKEQAKESTTRGAQQAKGSAEESGSYIGDKLSSAKESVKETLGMKGEEASRPA